MRNFILPCVVLYMSACDPANKMSESNLPVNTLSMKEKNDGWQLLFNGNTTAGWHTYNKSGVGAAWTINDNALHIDPAAKKANVPGGDIVTDESYDNFDFKYDWKIAQNGNSGIMFYVQEDAKYPYPWSTGPEMQVLDNAGHPDAKIVKHRAGDLYDLITAKEKATPYGEWNHAEVVAKNGDLRFYLNGDQILHTTMWDDNWRALIAGSKFKAMPGFGSFKSGKIALQDHGDEVWFRNLKIRRL